QSRPGTLRLRAKTLQSPPAVLERLPCQFQLVQRALARDDTIVVEFGEDAQSARGVSDLTEVSRRQQHPEVPALSHLVDVDEAVAGRRAPPGFLAFQTVASLRVGGELGDDLRALGRDLP